MNDEGLIVLGMFDKGYSKNKATLFLSNLEEEFLKEYTSFDYQKASRYSMIQFKSRMEKVVKFFNEKFVEKSEEAKLKVMRQKTILVESLEKILQRES